MVPEADAFSSGRPRWFDQGRRGGASQGAERSPLQSLRLGEEGRGAKGRPGFLTPWVGEGNGGVPDATAIAGGRPPTVTRDRVWRKKPR